MEHIYKNPIVKRRRRFPAKRWLAATMAIIFIAGTLSLVLKPGTARAAVGFVNKSTASGVSVSSQAISVPTGISNGQLLVTEVSIFNNRTPTITAPSGWTIRGTLTSSSSAKEAVYTHIRASGDASSYTWSFSRTSSVELGMAAFSGVDSTTPVDAVGSQANASSTTQTSPSVSANFSGDMAVPMFTYAAARTASTFTSGLTSMWQTNNTSVGFFGAYETLNNAGPSGTFQTTTTSAQTSVGFTLLLKSAAAAVGIKYVASNTPATCNTCSSLAANAPTGWVAGDFFVTSVQWNTNTATLTAPSGWTQIDSTFTNGTYALADFYHFAVSGDPSSYTWNFSGATQSIIGTSDYSGVDSSNPVDVTNNAVNASSSTTHAAAGVTTNFTQDMLVTIYGYQRSTTTSAFPSGMSSSWNTSNGGAMGSTSAHQTLGSPGATGTRTATSGSSTIALMHTVALKPFLPTPILDAPANNDTGDILKPVFQLVNASITATPLEYKIELCSTSNCSSILQTFDETSSQIGWSGQDQLTGTAYTGDTVVTNSTTATYTAQTALNPGTQYWWRGYSYDTGTTSFSIASSINTFTTSFVPSAPTFFFPTTGATGLSVVPEFQLASTDADSDNLQYKLQICADSACSTVLYTYDETSSQSGWSGQDSDNFTDYSSDAASAANSTTAYLTPTTQLSPNVQYWYRAYAIDPGGSNTFSSASSIGTFTTANTETRIVNGTILQGKIL